MENGQMPPYAPHQKPPGHGMALASLIIGIASMLGFATTLVLPIVGIVLAIQSKKQAQAAGIPPNSLATAGLIINIVSIVLVGLPMIACIACTGCILALDSL